jgi:hypothetical protein
VSEVLRPRARAAVGFLRLGERIHVTARVCTKGWELAGYERHWQVQLPGGEVLRAT